MRELESFARVELAALPTPLRKLENLSRELGSNIYIKRDDMTGLGLGGNKLRKLEFLLADAKARGCDTVLTTGGAQSNHAMLTAAAARHLGMNPILVLKKRGVWERKGNQLLNSLLGAEVRLVDTDSWRAVYAEMNLLVEKLEREGHHCYLIPLGGSVPLGSLGYVNCAREIREQSGALGVHFDRIICGCGSGGTHAGLVLGSQLYLPGTRVTGMTVDSSDLAKVVRRLVGETAALMEYEGEIPEDAVETLPVFGPGYAIPSPEGSEAIRLMAREEGLFLDPVYTGKAFSGLIRLAREGKLEENVLFVHTGGAGGIFALPPEC